MADLSRDDILNCNDLRREKLTIKEWGGDIYIRQLTAKEQDMLERESLKKGGSANIENMRARFAVMCVVDKNGKNLFSEEDIPKLTLKAGAVLNKIIEKASELNNISEKDLEEIAKNS